VTNRISRGESLKTLLMSTLFGVCLGALIGLAYAYFTAAAPAPLIVWWSAAIGAMKFSAGLSTAASTHRPEWRIWRALLVAGAIGAVALEIYREPQLFEFLKMMDARVYSEHILLGIGVGVLSSQFLVVRPQVRMRPNVPDAVKPYIDRAQAFEKNDEYDEAIKLYREALARFPDDPVLHNNLGCALANLKRYDDAKHHFEKAIALTEHSRQQNLLVPRGYPEIPKENLCSLRTCIKNKDHH
jgi:tetratricopeptide (TPR) repeat protein